MVSTRSLKEKLAIAAGVLTLGVLAVALAVRVHRLRTTDDSTTTSVGKSEVGGVAQVALAPRPEPVGPGKKPDGDLQVTYHRPTGKIPYHAQIQIGFDAPLVPLTNVGDRQRKEVLEHFSLTPKVPGAFRLVGIQAVVFSPESPFPPATRLEVVVRKGLTDVHGRKLAKDARWSLTTEPVRLKLRGSSNGVSLSPIFLLESNAALDVKSIESHVSFGEVFLDKTKRSGVDWVVTADKDNPSPVQEVTDYRRDYRYFLKPRQSLHKDTTYRLTLAAGVRPLVGNLASEQAVVLDFRTYEPLKFTFHEDDCGSLLEKSYEVLANNLLDEDSVEGQITLSPPIKGEDVWVSGYSWTIHLANDALKPDTDYTLTISTKVKDKFGQRLSKPFVHRFHTAHLRPDIDFIRGVHILTPRTKPLLPYRVYYPGRLQTTFLSVSPDQFVEWWFKARSSDIGGVLSEQSERCRWESKSFPEDTIETGSLDVGPSLTRSGFGLACYRLQTTRLKRCHDKREPVTVTGAVLRTNLGLHVQLLPSGLALWATHLTDGSPARGAEVRVVRFGSEKRYYNYYYRNRNQKRVAFAGPKLLVKTSTDKDGRVSIPAVKLLESSREGARYLKGNGGLVIVVREGEDFAMAAGRYPFDYGVYVRARGMKRGWDGPQVRSLGAIFTDRSLYQPQEEVKVKGVVRYAVEDRLVVPDGLKLKLTLNDPQGETRELGTVTTDEFGTFTTAVKPKPGERLGYYSLNAEAAKPAVRLGTNFRRADFRPPRYQAQLTTARDCYVVGEKIIVHGQADYLFGAPLAGGEATFRVNKRPAPFTPPGRDDYAFGMPTWVREWFEDRESYERELVAETKELDDRGRASVTVPVVAEGVPEPMDFELEVEARDVSGKSVGASKTVAVLPYEQLTGVKVKHAFVAAGNPVKASVITVDRDGKAVAGVKLRLELARLEWVERKVKDDDQDEPHTEWVRETEVLDKESLTSGKAPVTVSVTPPKAGQYLLIARFAGRKPTGTEGGVWLYASGQGRLSQRPEDDADPDLQVHVDRDEYQVGDVVEVAAPCPFKRARALFTVAREKIFEQRLVEVSEGVTTLRFSVTKEMVPNVYALLTLTEVGEKGGNLYGKPEHLPYRTGAVTIDVSRSRHRLNVEAVPRDPTRRPGETTVVNFHVEDADGRPARVQVTAMVVDEAILQLTGYRPPDLVTEVFPDRPLSLTLFDNRSEVRRAEATLPPVPKGWGYGDGESGGAIVGARLRKDFKHLAYFNADLRTDKGGNARCEFTVPDTLTTWRVMAVAASRENEFGFGEGTFVVKQPLMLNGLLPRFARVDDEFTAGVSINNQTAAKGKASVTCKLVKGGSLLEPVGRSGDRRTIEIVPNRTGAVRFPRRAAGLGECTLQFECAFDGRAKDGKVSRAADRLELPLEIREPGYWESVAVSQEVQRQTQLPFRLTDDIRSDLGEVKVSLASTAYGNLAPAAKWLLDYPYTCAEQVSSRVLGLLAMKEPVQRFGMSLPSDKTLDEVIKQDLATLLACQCSNGGFGYWPDASHSRYLSIYVGVVLGEAARRGYAVPKQTRDRLIKYLQRETFSGYDSDWEVRRKRRFQVRRAEALLALGAEYTQDYGELMSNRKQLVLSDQIRLAQLFFQNKDWKKQAATLLEDVEAHEWITPRGVHLEDWQKASNWWSWRDSTTAQTASGLRLHLLVHPDDSRVSKLARFLVAGERRKRYRNTADTAQLLDALGRFLEVREASPPDFTASVGVDRKRATDFRFKGYKLGLQEHTIPLRDLQQGDHQLVLEKAGRGTLYSTVELRYVPKGLQPPRAQGFFVDRTLTDLRTDKPIVSDAQPVRLGDIVRVKLTLNAPQDAYNVAVESPVPAGFEPVDTSFRTAPRWTREAESGEAGWRWNPFDHKELYRDRVVLFAQTMAAGVYEYEYLLQATNPGLFTYPATRIYRMYEPEEFATTKSERVRVSAS